MTTLEQNTRTVGSSAYFGERGAWLIVASMHRDSDILTQSNFHCMEKALEALPQYKAWKGEDCPVAVERFSHWAVGWVDYLVIHPDAAEIIAAAEEIREALEDYPVLDENDFSEREMTVANETWKSCYNPKDRAEYVRKHRSQFEFRDWNEVRACLRGDYFVGYASELIR